MSMDEQYISMPEMWGGIECSINRVGDKYRDQLDYSGYYARTQDIDHFATLGIRALRYPVLWEHHQPVQHGVIDWRWITRQLNSIRKHNIVPIAGLMHHGSGPSYTNLLDEEFPAKFASYAGKVARQFPWLEYYTPINEPLTTARFSGLYGLWYPHHCNEASFVKMLLHQLTATILAMQEIRKVNPNAKLVQTEDLSRTHSTPLLSYQADFENERRWLTYDLLCGRVNRQHFFWDYFISLGIPEQQLLFFIENSCPPDIMGFNYYVTSERYLDEDLAAYPAQTHGGNGLHQFADIEAVRTGHMLGISALLTAAWERYKLPIAVTECQLCCTREEQLRWLNETWTACCTLKKEGVDIRAVTAWALIGAYDWDSLLVQNNLSYEPGVFDVTSDVMRPSLLAKMISSLSLTGSFEHPVLHQRGWWNRTTGLNAGDDRPVLIIEHTSTAVDNFVASLTHRSIPYHLKNYDIPGLETFIKTYCPWAVIHIISTRNAGETTNYEDSSYSFCLSVAETCRCNNILLMTLSESGEQCKSKMLLVVNPSSLVVQLKQAGNTDATPPNRRTTDMLLDILIDEETGFWHISAEGIPTKGSISMPVYNYSRKTAMLNPALATTENEA